jgi:hypothetical protein
VEWNQLDARAASLPPEPERTPQTNPPSPGLFVTPGFFAGPITPATPRLACEGAMEMMLGVPFSGWLPD